MNIMKLAASFIISLIIIVSLALSLGWLDRFSSSSSAFETHISIETRAGNRHHFDVELALTPEQLRQGLMWRDYLAPSSGMLFLFAQAVEREFWMKNTKIPLDIIFIRENGTIARIYQNAVPFDERKIPSLEPVSAVLEINGGLSKQLNIQKGDQIHHSFFKTVNHP